MKKPLILFLIAVAVLIVAKLAYTKYCESKKEGCKKVKHDPNEGFPQEGIDW